MAVVTEAFPTHGVGILEPPSPALQNSIKFSNSGRYFSALCDFGVVHVCQLRDINGNFTITPVKRLTFDKGEHLESHAWSSDDEIFAVAGYKIYLVQVLKEFSSLRTIPLYYMPKDISLIIYQNSSNSKLYRLAVAGPNGVELYRIKTGDPSTMGESSSLHSDLAIALVQFSPDKQHLAVAALDGHFGIWSVSSLETDQKEFWYVHLTTVRITSMEFSPDSSMVAVAGWEGSWHSYRKKFQNERLIWEECHHGETTDRVSGDLPGSFLSWSRDNRFIRLTRCKDNKSCLSTFDTHTSITSVTPLDGIVKGMASFRGRSGDYSLCFLRSKKCFAVSWPIGQNSPDKITSAPKQPRKLLLEGESLEGSILVERSSEEGVTLQWRRTCRNILSLLRNRSKRQLSNTGAYCSADAQLYAPTHENVLNSKLQRDGSGSRSASYTRDGFLKTQDSDDINSHGKTGVNCPTLIDDSCKSTELNCAEAVTRMDYRGRKHGGLNELEPPLCEMSLKVHTGKIETRRIETFQSSQGPPTNVCHLEENEEYVPCVNRTFKASDEFRYIQAPFTNPRLFQGSCSNTSCFLSEGSVQLLISSNYVVVAVLPLLAYVYHRTSEEWKTLLFWCEVKCCCISDDKYVALLTNDGGIRIWCLESMEMLYSKDEVLSANGSEFQRCNMSGNPFEPQFNIIKLKKTGGGKVVRVRFQPDHGNACASINCLTVCYPELLSHACSTKLCGSIGHMIIFKQSPSNGHQHTAASQGCEDASLSKWIVIVPGKSQGILKTDVCGNHVSGIVITARQFTCDQELRISQTFLEDRECPLEEFVIRYHSDLCRLDSLEAMNR